MTSCTIVSSRDPFRRPWVHIDGHWQRGRVDEVHLATPVRDGLETAPHWVTTLQGFTITTDDNRYATDGAPDEPPRPSGRRVYRFPSVTPLP